MKSIVLALAATGLFMSFANAQQILPEVKHSSTDSTHLKWAEQRRKGSLQDLEAERKRVEDSETFKLKKKIDNINEQLSAGKITSDNARRLKEEAAQLAAETIDAKNAIIDGQKSLAERYDFWTFEYEGGSTIELGLGNSYDDRGSFLLGIGHENRRKFSKYDKRTFADVVLAGGVSTAVSNEHSLKDSPYKFWKSGFAEFGLTFRTRLLKESNFYRLAYGASLQIHNFELTGNRTFAVDGDKTLFEPFPLDLKRQKLQVTNLVFPVYLEFGPSTKREFYDKFRYSTVEHFKFGVGGFVGLNVGTNQSIRYYDAGRRIDDRQKRSFNTSNFVYGLGAYTGYGPIALYATYEFNPLFKEGPVEQNVLSLGMRIDL